MRVDALSKQVEHLTDLCLPSTPTSSPGDLNQHRIDQVTSILKHTPGGQALMKDLRRELAVSPSTMSRFVASLDDRVFEVVRRPHKNNEKIIKLRRQIGRDRM